MRRVVFLGATRGMGRALARLLAERGDRLFLLGRDEAELERSAGDLLARGAGGQVGTALLDLEAPETFTSALEEADRALEHFDTAVITAGAFGTQERLEEDGCEAYRVLTVNFGNTVALCEELRKRLLGRGGGTLCVFSSVAGDRARKPVVLYGASKAGLSYYLEGLDLRYRDKGLRVVCVRPGFVRTGMTAGLSEPPLAADPEEVAQTVLRGLDAGRSVVYAPPVWRLVMWVIRRVPMVVMRKVSF